MLVTDENSAWTLKIDTASEQASFYVKCRQENFDQCGLFYCSRNPLEFFSVNITPFCHLLCWFSEAMLCHLHELYYYDYTCKWDEIVTHHTVLHSNELVDHYQWKKK